MFIWYNNSIFASIISLIGCAGIAGAVSELLQDEAIRELSTYEIAGTIVFGILFVILGKVISVRKEKKKQAKARANAQAVQSSVSTAQTTAAKPAAVNPAATVANVKPAAGSAAKAKYAKGSVIMAGILYLFLFGMFVCVVKLSDVSIHVLQTELSAIGALACLVLGIVFIWTLCSQEANILHVLGFAGLAVDNAYKALKLYRIYGFGGYIAEDGSSYYVVASAPMIEAAAFLLLALFAIFSMRKIRKSLGGVVKVLWIVPFLLLAFANMKDLTDSYVYDYLCVMIENRAFDIRIGELAFLFAMFGLTLAVLFSGFAFRRICKKPAAEAVQTAVYVDPALQPAAPVQPAAPAWTPAPAQPESTRSAPVQTSNQEIEKKLQAYKDLLECGILSQEEYDKKVRELTRG